MGPVVDRSAETMGAMKLCKIAACGSPLLSRGLCVRHYTRLRRHGDPMAMSRMEPVENRCCSVDGCDNRTGRAGARGLCVKHLCRSQAHGTPLATVETRQSRIGPCAIDGCAGARKARGHCNRHYMMLRRTGIATGRMVGVRRRVDARHGYVFISMAGRQIHEHRLVMQGMLGRPLLPSESVHHKNGNRQDNRESNLELWSRGQPAGQRVQDKVAWARELLALYQPETEWIGAGC